MTEFFEASLREALNRGTWGIVLLLAPALFLDTTRYVLTNVIYSFCYALKKLFWWGDKRDTTANDDDLPFLSVIVPAFNEGEHLRVTLDSILQNDYPRFEVLVIDDCSSDITPQIAGEYQAAGKIRYLKKKTRGSKPAALNYGLQFARGEILVHLDGDSVLEPGALREVVKPFKDPRVGCVSGNLNVSNAGDNLWTLMQSAEFGITIGVQRRWLSVTDTLQIASGAFGIFRRKILRSLQGVDPEYGEDLDVTIKIRKMGYRVAFCAKAVALTEMPTTLKGIFNQRLRWDRCYVRLNLRKHGNLMNLHRFRAGDFADFLSDFLFNLVLLFVFPIYIALIAVFVPQMTPFILIVTYAYYTLINLVQVAMAISFSDRPSKNWKWLLTVPFMFPYSLYLRVIRAMAYTLEGVKSDLFKGGYIPEAIRKQSPDY